MPKATFYTHVSHAEAFICRLAQRAVQSGSVLVWAEGAAVAERLDAELWRFEPTGFLAHEMWQGREWPQDVPLLLGAGADLPAVPADWVVLNVSSEFWCDAARPPARVL